MNKIIRILIVEDSPEDAECCLQELRRTGFEPVYRIVNDRENFLQAIRGELWDLVLSDFMMPRFDAVEALQLVREHTEETPFVIVTGSINEETAVDSLKRGADNYILKDNLRRLGPAVQQALKVVEERRSRQRLEQQLRQSQRLEAVGVLAGGIAHDFNNILTAITGHAVLLLDDLPEGSGPRENVDEILKAGRRAAELVRQILTFSRKGEQVRRSLSISAVLDEVCRLVRASVPSTISMKCRIDKDSGHVLGDASQIHQIVMNLCTNAYQAMAAKGGVLEVGSEPVSVSAARAAAHAELHEGPYVRIWISDTGPGIDPAIRGQIFEPFFTTKPAGRGTGLGLSVVHGIARSHHGAVDLSSELGRGTCFSIYLPRHRHVDEGTIEPVVGEAHGSERVLLVDDEESVLEIGRRMLERLGYSVTATGSSKEALALFRARPSEYDLVVSDFIMPSMTGTVLARRIRGLRADLPIVLLTGFGELPAAKRLSECGVRSLLRKPFVLSELAQTVRAALDATPV